MVLLNPLVFRLAAQEKMKDHGAQAEAQSQIKEQEEEERYGAGGQTKRPRKPDTETLTYLRSLEPVLDANLEGKNRKEMKWKRKPMEEVEGGLDDDEGSEEDQEEVMVSNVLEELAHKVSQ